MTEDREEPEVTEDVESASAQALNEQSPEGEGGDAETNGTPVPTLGRETVQLVPASARRASGTLMPLPADQVVEGMRAYQRLLRDLLEPSDWQTRDRHGDALDKPFLKKSGWRKIARAFNLSFERVHSVIERESDGTPLRAEVWIRAVAPNGQYGDGDGYCSAEEGRFRTGRGRQKLENDLRTTAATRAKNRATADLVGMGEVSAEEIAAGGEDDEQARALAAGVPASEELAQRAFGALAYLLGGDQPDRENARQVGERITSDHGYLPVAAGRALCYAATMRAGRAGAEPGQAAEPTPSGDATDSGESARREEPNESVKPATPEEPVEAVPHAGVVERSPAEVLEYWREKGRYPEGLVTALAALLFGDGPLEALRPQQLAEAAFMVECGVRGKVSRRSLESWVATLASHDDRRAAAEALRRRLIEKANEVELSGRREAA